GAVFRSGSLVSLSAYAYDVDDGVLDGTAVRWASDLDGPLGAGATVTAGKLRPGQHRITMTATDSDGNQATQSVTIRVAGAGPSLALTVAPVPSSPGACMQASVRAAPGSVELARLEYSVDGGISWTSVPIAS